MRKPLLCVLVLLICFNVFSFSASGASHDKVVLQLTWYHEFQYAGYYAAKIKGYYAQEGLDVDIRERDFKSLPVDMVLSGDADFGNATSDLMLLRMQGKPVVAVACIMQHSPWGLLVRADSDIHVLEDLIGKTISMDLSYRDVEILAMFSGEGIPTDKMNIVRKGTGVKGLLDGSVDARISYMTSQPFDLEEQGIAGRFIRPLSYGIDFYGDTLFTSEQQIREHPKRVAAFRRASLRGWEYAMEHPEEIIEYIYSTYYADPAKASTSFSREHLEFEAKVMADELVPALVEMGHMNPRRWQRIADTYVEMGMAESIDSLEGFLYDPNPLPDYTLLRWVVGIVACILLLVLFCVGFLVVFNSRLRQAVRERTSELELSNQQLIAGEQQLRASNQQLIAGEQQLKAANQQLIANEQQLRAANQQLQFSERQYHLLFTEMTGGLAVHEMIYDDNAKGYDYRFLQVNPAFEELTGLRAKDIIGKTALEILPGTEAHWIETYDRVASTGKSIHFENYSQELNKHYEVIAYCPEKGKFATFFLDVTKRKQAEEELRESEKKSRAWLEHSPVCTKMVDLDFNLQYMSAAGIKGLGVEDITEFYGKPYPFDFYPELFRNTMNENLQRVKETGEIITQEASVVDLEGKELWFQSTLVPVNDDEGQIDYIMVVSIETTERREAEEALRLSEDKFSKAFLSSPDSISITSVQSGRILEINEGFEKMFGYSRQEAIGKTTLDLELWQSDEDRDAMLKEIKDRDKARDFEIHVRDKSGDIHDCLISCEIIDINAESCLVAITRDITEQKRKERELASYRSQLQSLISELTLAEEHARREIAGMLHDDVIQKLAIYKMKIGVLIKSLDSDEHIEALSDIHDNLTDMLKNMRTLTFDLCPPILYDIGLEAAIRDWLSREVGDKHGIDVDFEAYHDPLQLSEDIRVALYRATRELLMNVIKHAEAQSVNVMIEKEGDLVRIEVVDDGKGFYFSSTEGRVDDNHGGLGLFTVRERLQCFGGSLEIISEPGKGCRAILTAPLTG